MSELICIVCPVGCSLAVDEALSVTGNRCPRGAVYAREEITDPKRTVTATCATDGGGAGSHMRIPVKTSAPCPKEKIPLLLKDIYNIRVSLPVKIGDAVIENWHGSGIDIIATRNIT